MRVGILGTGDVGKALGRGFVTLGHEVKMGGREAKNPKAEAWAREMGPKASSGSFADAAELGEVVVLATPGTVSESVLAAAGPDRLAGKVLIDATNPVGAQGLMLSGNDSGGEQVQRLAPRARVVKAFNTVGHALMFRPELPGGPPDMLIAGNDAAAKKTVAEILGAFGWGAVDIGGIESSRYLEAMCVAWIRATRALGSRDIAFKLLRK